MKRFRLKVPLAFAVALAATVPAWAFYGVVGSGSGTGTVGTLTAPTDVTVPASSAGSHTVSWNAATVNNAGAASSITYTVERKESAGSWMAAGGTCAGTLQHSTLNCQDSVTTNGSYTYRVTAKLSGWTAASEPSNSVQVTTDTTPPNLTTLQMFDSNANGKVDQVKATFSETIQSSTATDPWTLTNVPSNGSLSSVSTSGSVATLTLAEGTGAADTAVKTFKVALAADSAGIKDAAGNQASFAATSPDDKAAPVKTLMEAFDASPSATTARDGKIDQVKVTFSEDLAASTNTSVWTFTGTVPSGGTLGTVGTATNVATLAINPAGASSANTAIGNWQIALGKDAAGIRDSAGNESEFVATAPADEASPVPTAFTDTPGAADGKFEAGDTAILTFSEDVTNTATTSNVVLTGGSSGSANDLWRAPGLLDGTTNTSLGRSDYMLGNNNVANFSSSTLTQPANNQVQLTLGTCSAGTPTTVCTATTGGNRLGTAGDVGDVSLTPSTTIKDAANNTALPNSGSLAFSIRLF